MLERTLFESRRASRRHVLVTRLEQEHKVYYAVFNSHPAKDDPEALGKFAVAQGMATDYLVESPQAVQPERDVMLATAGYKRLYLAGQKITSPEAAETAFFDLLRQYEERDGEDQDRKRLCWLQGKLSLPFLATKGIHLKFDGWQRRVFDMMGRGGRYTPLLSGTELVEHITDYGSETPIDDAMGIRAITLHNTLDNDSQWLEIICVDRALRDDVDDKQLEHRVTLGTPHNRWFNPNDVELHHYSIRPANGGVLTIEDDAIARHYVEYKRLYGALEKVITR